MRAIVRDESGASLMFTAISMVVCLGMAALAIDVGMLYAAKGQAQNAADSGALAGAGSLLISPNDDTSATNVAEDFGEKHLIIKQQVDIVPGADVQVDLPNQRVTVTARRINARGNAVPTFFARILGWDLVDIQATATAEVQPASSTACLKPWIIPDAYADTSAPFGEYNAGDYYEQGVTSWGTTYRTSNADFGVQLMLKPKNPSDAIAPGQYSPVELPLPDGSPETGADQYRWNIANCNGEVVEIGDLLWTETGNMAGPTQQGVAELIALDPDAGWDNTLGVVNSAFPPGASPRLIRVPMFDPTNPPTSGNQQLRVTNIGGFFLEGVQGNGRVTGRLMPTQGVGDGTPGPLLNTVRLVR